MNQAADCLRAGPAVGRVQSAMTMAAPGSRVETLREEAEAALRKIGISTE